MKVGKWKYLKMFNCFVFNNQTYTALNQREYRIIRKYLVSQNLSQKDLEDFDKIWYTKRYIKS